MTAVIKVVADGRLVQERFRRETLSTRSIRPDMTAAINGEADDRLVQERFRIETLSNSAVSKISRENSYQLKRYNRSNLCEWKTIV